KSTDFEVHRNWLAITHSLPLDQWYYDNTSQWTLDYPPLFAWFEYLLSHVAAYFDEKMLDRNSINYDSIYTILFQRLSVIATDLVLAYGVKECSTYVRKYRFRKCSKWRSKLRSPAFVLQIIIICNVGLFIVDHLHFQYNGLLFGILLTSISYVLQGHYNLGAFWFAFLLNMKHIYLYMAPAYVVYLLRNYCFTPDVKKFNTKTISLTRTAKLGAVVLGVFCMSFGPFIILGQLTQVLGRLFPFKRGLCHSYWAPNFWALYNFLDKIAAILGRAFGYNIKTLVGSMTGGLVQEFEHSVLPSITPCTTFLISFLSTLPCLWKLWHSPGNPLHFVRCLVICSGCAFMFGWHVHEKAILMVIIPLSLTAVQSRKEAEIFIFLSTVGHYSMLPLIFTPNEIPIKILVYVIYSFYTYNSLSDLFGVRKNSCSLSLLSKVETLYILILAFLFMYENVIHKVLQLDVKYPFLPLMLTSVYCSIGLMYGTIKMYWLFLNANKNDHKQKTF
ncbi:hypothetical protein AAG570_008168, partial [Ranatra chinensis]